MRKKLILLAGPSCVGKGPLRNALIEHYPEIEFAEPVWCHSRKPRLKKTTGAYEVHGVDYYFMPRSAIENLDPARFIVAKLRSEVQAVDKAQLEDLLNNNSVVFTEIYHSFLPQFYQWIKELDDPELEVRSVFLTPFSDEELEMASKKAGKSREEVVYETMKTKLEKRGEDPPDKIEERAREAYGEMLLGRDFTDVIGCPCGEDNLTEWSRPLGSEAARVLEEFVRVFR